MKNKFNSDDNMPLNKILKLHNMTIVIRSADEEPDICHYWYFKEIGFKFEPYLCNGCHGLMQKAMNLMTLLL